MSQTKIKVILFFANYGPYHIARLKSFCELAGELNWQVVPLELTRSGISYDWKTQINSTNISVLSVLGNREPDQVSFSQLIKKLYRILQEIQPDIIATAGYFRPAMLATLVWGRYRRVPTILMSDSKEDDAQRSWFVEKIKALLVQAYGAYLVAGHPHKRYLSKLGMPSEAIFFGYDVVGNEDFSPSKTSHLSRPIKRDYFLAINRFIPRKNLLFLLDVYSVYRAKSVNDPWDLVLCGSGQLCLEIHRKIDRLNLTEYVHLPGFLQQEKLLPYFAHASCFVHASLQEQWGLVVNEAMAAGLPVLVSDRCGCFEDLVLEGINGFGFDPENKEQLTDLMLKMSSGAVDLLAMKQISLQHIQKYSPDYFARGLKEAVNYALNFN